MNNKKVWLITGAGRGMGVDITKAALSVGHKVVATGRNTDSVVKAIGDAENLLIVKLDVTNPADAEAAAQAAVEKFGSIDVLVNNAANFYAGFFEELTIEQINKQLQTSLIGPMIVTRAVLPVMRKQMFRSYHFYFFNCRPRQATSFAVPIPGHLSLALKDGCRHFRLK